MNSTDKTIISDMFTMFHLVAPVITGRRCQVRARAPFEPSARGTCIYQTDGSVIIDIDPRIPFKAHGIFADFRQLYKVFLHECGHAKLHYFRYEIGGVVASLPPKTFSFDWVQPETEREKIAVKKQEEEANIAVMIWDTLAAQNSTSALVWWNRIGILSHIVQTPETIRLAALARPVLAQQFLTMIGALPAGRNQR